jgi:hypothetical protein
MNGRSLFLELGLYSADGVEKLPFCVSWSSQNTPPFPSTVYLGAFWVFFRRRKSSTWTQQNTCIVAFLGFATTDLKQLRAEPGGYPRT